MTVYAIAMRVHIHCWMYGKLVKLQWKKEMQTMERTRLIGQCVMNTKKHAIGRIEYISEGIIGVNYHGEITKHSYPAAFDGILELEDEELQEEMQSKGIGASFKSFKNNYQRAINKEIEHLKSTGGKKYKIVDGEKLPSKIGEYLYAFDTDTNLHFPDGTAIKLWFPENIVPGYVVFCEDFTIMIRSMEYIGEKVDSVEFTSEQWQLLEALMERLSEMEPNGESLAYQIACNGSQQIERMRKIKSGQNLAFNKATSEKITFIWGPPGTGKTETLANIALEHMYQGRRVLMLSYSNVSVDGALLRVSKKADLPEGMVIRYGYPRTKELLESKTLTSYKYVLYKNPGKAAEYQELLDKKKKMKQKDPERIDVKKRLNRNREQLLEQERELIYKSSFVATTVSKATVDKAVYMQKFDVVIFDEASMAYVPQIVFAAGIAKDFFVCLGDFCQLPAIVQNREEERLIKDIFEYTGITSAVENGYGHKWLVMLDMQYRMHQDIADFVSEYMYKSRLKTSEKISESRNKIAECHPCPNAAMSVIDLSDMYSVCTKTMDGSRINILSALICLRLAEININQHDVGIITPYSAQSRLILAMIRDIQEYDKRWQNVSCATVHQFQGSEKPMIIYDAVDCFRMQYPGVLLTSLKNDTANRLFNVALTRTKGKFVLVTNIDFLKRKNISQNLIFTKVINKIKREQHSVYGEYVLDEIMPKHNEEPVVYAEDRMTSWKKFMEDISGAKSKIHMDIPDIIDENDEAILELVEILEKKKANGVDILIRLDENIDLPKELHKYAKPFKYITTPVTIIDKKIIWFGQPLYEADFISEGNIIDTKYFPCLRFVGIHAARFVKAFLEM